MKNFTAGASRQQREYKSFSPSLLSDAIFVPPSPEELPDLLSDLEKFWHNPSLQLPYLIKIAITHYQFETIHPFLDGNGRCRRLLIVLQLIDAQLLDKPVLYTSTFFEKNKVSYYNALTRVRTANDLEQWIVFFLTGIVETAQHGLKTFKAIIALRQEYDTKILTLGPRAKNAQKLLQHMYATPIEDDVFDILLNPIAVIEVLSLSTEAYDRGDKFAHYRQLHSLQEYILVSQDKVCVEHYVRQTKQWILTDFQKLEQHLPLTSIQCELPLQEIYERVPFPE